MTIQYTQLSAGSDVNNLVEFNYSPYWYAESSKLAGGSIGVLNSYNTLYPCGMEDGFNSEVCQGSVGYCANRTMANYSFRMNPYVPTRLQECDGTWVIPTNFFVTGENATYVSVSAAKNYLSTNFSNTHQGRTIIEIDAFGNQVLSKFNTRYFPCKTITDRCGCEISHFIGTVPPASYVLRDGSAIYDGPIGHCTFTGGFFNGTYYNCDYKYNNITACWTCSRCTNHIVEFCTSTWACRVTPLSCTWATHHAGPGAVGNVIHRSFINNGGTGISNAVGAAQQIWACCPCLWYQSGTIRYGDGHSMQYTVNAMNWMGCYDVAGISFVFDEHSPENLVSEVFVCAACNGNFDGSICTRNVHSSWVFAHQCITGLNVRKGCCYGFHPNVMHVAATIDPYDCNNFYVGWVDTLSRCGADCCFCCNFYNAVLHVAYLCAGCAGYQEYCRDYGYTGQIIKYTAPDFSSTCEPTFVKSWQFRKEDLGSPQQDQAIFTLSDIETRNCHLYTKPVILDVTQISTGCAVTTMPNVLFCECNCNVKYVTHFSAIAGGGSVPFDWVYTCRCTWVTLSASTPASYSCQTGCQAFQRDISGCGAGGFCALYLTEWSADFLTSYGTVEIQRGPTIGSQCGMCQTGVYFAHCLFGGTYRNFNYFRLNYNHLDDTVLVQIQGKQTSGTSFSHPRPPDLLKLPSDISCVCDYYQQLYSCGKIYQRYSPTCHTYSCACISYTFNALNTDCTLTDQACFTDMHSTAISDFGSNGYYSYTRIVPKSTGAVLTQAVICSSYCFCDKPEICYTFCGLCAHNISTQCTYVWNRYTTCMRCICIYNPCGANAATQRKLLPKGPVWNAYRPYNDALITKPLGGYNRTDLDFKYT